jgi:hypothetical protein
MSAPVPARLARTPRSPVAVLRGLAAVAVFLLSAVDALLAAWLGVPRLGWLADRLASACGERYRSGAWHAPDAQVIDDVGTDGPGDPAGAGTPGTGGGPGDEHEGEQ